MCIRDRFFNIIQELKLTEQEKADIVTFMLALKQERCSWSVGIEGKPCGCISLPRISPYFRGRLRRRRRFFLCDAQT